jgi:ABC-type uncharacterized transport system permease subunit
MAALSPWSVVPALIALVAYALAILRGRPWAERWALPVAWVAHGTALMAHLFGVGLPGTGARFGFAPALSTTAWLVLTVHAVESRFVPIDGVRRWLAALGGLSLLLALAFPGEGTLHPGSPWAPLHWLLGLASYGLFGAAVLHGTLLDRSERAMRQRLGSPRAGGLPLLTLEKLTFRFVSAGFVALTLALVFGMGFTATWHWDHKTVFSLLGWAVFAALLTGRQAFGWRGRRATRWLYFGTALLLLAYVGTRFVFEVLLHRSPAAL